MSPTNPAHPRDWLKVTESMPGSGWPERSSRLADGSGGEKDRAGEPGSSQFRPMGPASCLYVVNL